MLSLENICNRLVIVPKPARVSALRAELTALNHKLPAEVNLNYLLCRGHQLHVNQVCMPLWCSSSDGPEGKNDIPVPHHKIVRIPPGEAVALNSAERAPYLLYIEILKDDLDFNPAKRTNKEILRRIVTKDDGQNHGWSEPGPLISFQVSTPRLDTTNSFRAPCTSIPFLTSLPTASPSTSTFSDADEEMDLVEQLYGADHPLRSNMPDIEDSIVLPPTPKNRELDMVAWSRTSLPSSDDLRIPVQPHSQSHSRASSFSRTLSSSPAAITLPSVEPEVSRALSLDEYSERMRTAAIMLAQLNMDQSRDPLPLTPKAEGPLNTAAISYSRE